MIGRSAAHAALLLSVACAFAIIACSPRTDAAARGPVTVAFDSTDASRLGDVSVYPLNREALAKLESSHPSAEDWQRILSVRVTDAASGDSAALPLLGTYTVSADTLRFHPRFSPVTGVTYAARFDGSALYRHVGREPPAASARLMTTTWRHNVPAGVPSTVVREIYPTASVVPMNLLRMYVEFSAPMTSGRSYEFLKLYGDDGSLVEDPFFTAGNAVELWDPDHTRLTILFDPGRIKRDLKPHEELGLPLRAGKRYRLVIDSGWRDAEGRPLVRSHVKEFRVGPQDRALVRSADWRVVSPRAGTNDSLVLTFPEPLDRALLARLLTVRDSAGALIHGAIAVSESETRWAFAPRVAWKRTPHAVHVDTELEDLAGNNLKKLFDVVPEDTASIGVSAAVVRVPFQPR